MPVFIDVPKGKVLTQERVRAILKEADTNMDGRLSKKELRQALKKMGSHVPIYRAHRCFQIADTNHDGQLSGAEMDKLVAYIMEWLEGKH